MDVEITARVPSYPEIAVIFDDVFQYTEPLTASTSPSDVDRWDSLQHIALVQAIETTFGIKLSMDEMMEIQSVGDIERILRRYGV
ncbi:MAG TPA: acyl carrier protein [Hyphomicrobium sp.]|nr:acyl carrier protein [Hyphomicrobium sp.]